MTEQPHLLETQDITKYYGNVVALRGVSMHVDPGEVRLGDRLAEVHALDRLGPDPDVGVGLVDRDGGDLEQAQQQPALQRDEHRRERDREHPGGVPLSLVPEGLQGV